MKIIYLVLASIISLSCKSNNEEKQISDNSDSIVNDSISSETIKQDTDIIDAKFENLKLCKIYFYKANESIVPEVSIEEVSNIFSKITIKLSENEIVLNGQKSSYKIEKMNSKKFFTRKYIYDVKVDAFKKGFGINLSNEVTYLDLSIENNEISPFKDYFMEAGDAVFVDNTLFLNYKEYIISFVKEKDIKKCDFVTNKISNGNLNQSKAKLPFDFDDYKKNNENISYKVYSTDELPEITKLINSQINEFPVNIVILDNGGLAFQSYVIETDGDSSTQILVNIKDDKVLGNKIIGFESGGSNIDEYNTFIININLSVDMFKVNSKNNSRKMTSKLQIKPDGTIVKVK